MVRTHINSRAVGALLALAGEDKTRVARRADMTPGHLRDIETGRNIGRSFEVRKRLAAAFDTPAVTAVSLSCWCDRPDGVCRAITEGEKL